MKTKAFTILEALISLILISIIIGLIFMLLNFMNKQLALISDENTHELEYNIFNTTLQRDISNAIDFSMVNDDLILKNYNDTEITYTILKDAILRKTHIATDSFNLKIYFKSVSQRSFKSPYSNMLKIDIALLNDTIHGAYFLKKNAANHINKTFYNED